MNDALRTVLIFAHECAPYHRPQSTIGAQRPAQFAKYLPEFGWRAIVLCCDDRARRTEMPADLAMQVRQRLESAKADESVILATPSLPFDGVFDRWWQAMAAQNGDANAAKTVLRKALTVGKLFTGDYSQSWQPCAKVAADAVMQTIKVDACLAEHTPDAGLFLANWFAERYGVKWVADFRDPILQPLRPLARKLYRPIARRLLASAQATINVNPYWTKLDGELFGLPAYEIPNGFDPDEFRASNVSSSPTFTLAYAGRIDRLQRLEIFFEGLAKAKQQFDDSVFSLFRFWYRGVSHQQVAQLAEEFGVMDMIDSAPPIERERALEGLMRAQMLLLLSVDSSRHHDRYFRKGFYPAKTFEYFGADKPILCVPGDGGMLDALITETQTGTIQRTSEEVAAFLQRTLQQWQRGAGVAYQPNRQVVRQFSRRAQALRLADVLNHTVGLKQNDADL